MSFIAIFQLLVIILVVRLILSFKTEPQSPSIYFFVVATCFLKFHLLRPKERVNGCEIDPGNMDGRSNSKTSSWNL